MLLHSTHNTTNFFSNHLFEIKKNHRVFKSENHKNHKIIFKKKCLNHKITKIIKSPCLNQNITVFFVEPKNYCGFMPSPQPETKTAKWWEIHQPWKHTEKKKRSCFWCAKTRQPKIWCFKKNVFNCFCPPLFCVFFSGVQKSEHNPWSPHIYQPENRVCIRITEQIEKKINIIWSSSKTMSTIHQFVDMFPISKKNGKTVHVYVLCPLNLDKPPQKKHPPRCLDWTKCPKSTQWRFPHHPTDGFSSHQVQQETESSI